MPAALIVNKRIEPTFDQRQILLGSLLGDGHLCLPERYDNAALVEQHSMKQKLYVDWKSTYLCDFEPRTFSRVTFNPYRKKYYQFYVLKTPVHPYLTQLRKLFYVEGKKIIPVTVLDELSALGLAIWWCDDGSYRYRNKSGCIATDCYSYSEQLMLKDWFMKKWNLPVRVVKSSYGNYRLDINPVPMKHFLSIISPFVPECMKYKIGCNEKHVQYAKLKKKERDRIHYRKHREQMISKGKIWYEKNREHKAQYDREYRERRRCSK